MLNNKELKGLGVFFAVVLLGVGLFDVGISYIYRDELRGGACDICFKVNPDLAVCENYKQLNISELKFIKAPPISYGE